MSEIYFDERGEPIAESSEVWTGLDGILTKGYAKSYTTADETKELYQDIFQKLREKAMSVKKDTGSDIYILDVLKDLCRQLSGSSWYTIKPNTEINTSIYLAIHTWHSQGYEIFVIGSEIEVYIVFNYNFTGVSGNKSPEDLIHLLVKFL